MAARSILKAPMMAEDIDDKIGIPDLMSRISGQGAYEFADSLGIEMPFNEVKAWLIMDPGYPWSEEPGATESPSYWSAKKRKMIKPERPGWLINVVDPHGGEVAVGVNPCAVFPAREPDRIWPIVGRASGVDVFVTHAMALLKSATSPFGTALGPQHHRKIEGAIRGVQGCGGLLFPSLAIGPVPASNFGPIALVGHLGLVLDGLKPYRKRGTDAASWVYEHDAWTVTTGNMMSDVAVRLFDELHGHEDFTYGYHIWTTGVPSELFGGPSRGSTPVSTTKQLVAAIKQRSSSFKRSLTEEQFAYVSKQVEGTVDKYFYCEAKARSVISLDEFPFMIGPDTLGAEMRMFAHGVGYKGQIVELPDTVGAGSENATDYELFQWSWIVADAIRALGDTMEIR
jgi:hypothetical protein